MRMAERRKETKRQKERGLIIGYGSSQIAHFFHFFIQTNPIRPSQQNWVAEFILRDGVTIYIYIDEPDMQDIAGEAGMSS